MKRIAILGWLVVGLVFAVIVLGFMVTGSPQEARLRKLDDKRYQDLVAIVNSVQSYYSKHKALPKHLSDLDGRNHPEHLDPQSEQPYGYRVVDNVRYELSAKFQTDTTRAKPYRWISSPDISPKHRKGLTRYTIDARPWDQRPRTPN